MMERRSGATRAPAARPFEEDMEVSMGLTVAILGATGAVGDEFLKVLAGRDFPVGRLRLMASAKSAARKIAFRGEAIPVEDAAAADFSGVDVAFFSAGAVRSRTYAPAAVRAGAVVVDNSSAFRMDPRVPLVVPEVNPDALDAHEGIIANPNCTTIIALMAVAPLHLEAGAKALRAASYQAASGAGARAMAELLIQTKAILEGREAVHDAFPHPLAFNVIPHVGSFLPDGSTEEERKLRDESRKILSAPDLLVSATCVRVPVLRSHSVACWLTTERPISVARAREVLAAAHGVKLLDDPAALAYPMPIFASGEDAVRVGRIRVDEAGGPGLSFFAAGDQLLKGAALNAVQIAEELIRRGRL
jgi:aspartate-semialdehyde dehydrogenase